MYTVSMLNGNNLVLQKNNDSIEYYKCVECLNNNITINLGTHTQVNLKRSYYLQQIPQNTGSFLSTTVLLQSEDSSNKQTNL